MNGLTVWAFANVAVSVGLAVWAPQLLKATRGCNCAACHRAPVVSPAVTLCALEFIAAGGFVYGISLLIQIAGLEGGAA